MGDFDMDNFMDDFEDFLKGDQNNMEPNSFENQVPERHLVSLRNRAIGAVLLVGGGLDIAAALETKWNIIFQGLATIPAIGSMLVGLSLNRGHTSISIENRNQIPQDPPEES